MKKVYLYPFWLRFWHWLNALLFLILIISGISLHYAETSAKYLDFKTSMLAHNISGVLLTINYLLFVIASILTGNIKHYIPKLKGLGRRIYLQVRFYALGIFLNEYHPFHTSKENKFNPIQQLAYLGVMFGLMPILLISGWLLLFPELAPDEILGMGGVWPMALAHTIAGFLLSIFMLTHIYLATTGNTIFELVKSMITGWHLEPDSSDAHIAHDGEKLFFSTKAKIKKLFPVIFYNPITLIGATMIIISIILDLLLVFIGFFLSDVNPYLGIFSYIVLPAFILFGLILIFVGAIIENRKILSAKVKDKRLPIIDLNNAKHQIALLLFSGGTIIVIVLLLYGLFQTYKYTDTSEFCGTVCHEVMQPQFVTYSNSPHSNVPCVKCHIDNDAKWYIRSKVGGVKQVVSVLFDRYPRPIPTPLGALRPSQKSCEKCHWPKFFHNDQKVFKKYYLSDKENSEYKISYLLKISGSKGDFGKHGGIHHAMVVSNDIYYLPLDSSRNVIPWIKVISKIDGTERVYRDTTIKFDESLITDGRVRKFDCIDCHNRPSHIFTNPYTLVNKKIASGEISRTLPCIKKVAIQALESYTFSRETSEKDIRTFITRYYKNNYPELLDKRKKDIDRAIYAINEIYLHYYFPKMKANWKKYDNHLGHIYSPGCFRCHDNKHVSNDNKVITNDCNVCHTVIYQKLPNQESEHSVFGLKFKHPGGFDVTDGTKMCYDCHDKNPSKRKLPDKEE